MDNYKPRLYTKIKYSKERLENEDPHTHAVTYSNINVHDSMKVFYTNELNKEKSANFLREGIIDCDMRNKDIHELSDNLIIVESSLFDKYFDHFTENKRELKRDEISGFDFLIELNKKEYNRLILSINDINEKLKYTSTQKSSEHLSYSLRKKYLIQLKQKFDSWFATHNVLDQIKVIIPTGGLKLHKKDAISLLESLEDDSYDQQGKDVEMISHRSFKRYQSDHVKNLVSDTFKTAFEILYGKGKLTYQEFFKLSNPPSKWYQTRFIESFYYHCINPRYGKYKKRCGKRVINKKGQCRENMKIVDCFTL